MRARRLGLIVVAVLLTAELAGCGGGGGGGVLPIAQVQPPAYTVDGTWNISETVTGGTCANAGGPYTWSVWAVHTEGSNFLTVQDTRAFTPVNATISGSTITFSGDRYNELPAQCDSMAASYKLTLSSDAAFSGSGIVTCSWYGGHCTATTTLTGSKQPAIN